MNEINKNWYWKVNSQEEANRLLDWLETQGNKCYRELGYCEEWESVGFSLNNDNWQLLRYNYISENPQLILQSKFPWEELTTPEELLEEAKRRYPVGTTYKCASGSYFSNIVSTQDFKIYSEDIIYGESGKGCLYYKGKWAGIAPSSDSNAPINDEETICETCNGTGQVMVAKLYPSGHTEVKEDCPDCNGTGYIETKSDNNIPKFEVGKWYKCSCNSNYYRCSGYNDKYFESDAVINIKGCMEGCYQPGFTYRLEKKNCIEYFHHENKASIEEIQQYLPDGHIDKFPTSDNIPEYVECVSTSCSKIFTNGKIYRCEIGTTTERVTLVDEFGGRDDYPYNGVVWAFKPSTKEAYDAQNSVKSVEPVKSSDGNLFKEGDWIIAIADYSYLKKGMLARVDNNDAYPLNDPKSTCVSISKYIGEPCYPYKSYIRKATQKEIDSINSPKPVVEPNYDTSTTITRAVKANDPSIIIRESGKSVDELCRLVDESLESCLADKIEIGCAGLSCSGHNCPFSTFMGKTKESAKAWLRGNSSSKVESTSNTTTMDTNQFRVRCISNWEGFTIGKEYVFPYPIDDEASIRGNIDNWDRWKGIFQKIEGSPTISTYTNQSNNIKITDLKPGMWVRLKNRRGNLWNAAGYMDKYIGQVVQITNTNKRGFFIYNDENSWYFEFEDIEEILKAHNPITSNNGVVTPVETLLPQPEIKEEFEVTKVQPLTRPKYIGRIN